MDDFRGLLPHIFALYMEGHLKKSSCDVCWAGYFSSTSFSCPGTLEGPSVPLWPLQYLPVHAVQTLAHAEGFSFEDSRKAAAPGVGGALQKVGARSSRGLLKAPLLGSTLKFPEEVHPPP